MRLLVVAPCFHGYGASIARSFERLGYQSHLHLYDKVDRVALKAWNKIRYELPARVSGGDAHQSAHRVTRIAIEALRQVRPDVVLVVRGDVLGTDFWQAASAGGRPVVVWLYDEVRRTPAFDLAAVAQHAALATYSPLDARSLTTDGIPTLYVPTGFDDERQADRPRAVHPERLISFIGNPLPGRISALTALSTAGVPVRAWGRGWSDHPLDRARTWRLRGRGLPNGRDIPGSTALSVMRDTAASLNVHGDQDGFTMRTFEICAVGGVQLIDRADVHEFYEPDSEVLVFTGEDELIELAQRVLRRPDDFGELRGRARERTLAEHTFVHRARALEQLWQ